MLDTISKLPKWLTRGLVLPLLVLNGWLLILVFEYFQSLITIFATATLLSFILDYPVRFLEKKGIKRAIAILIVLLMGILLFSIIGVTVIPILIDQLNGLLDRLPSYVASGSEQAKAFEIWADERNFPVSVSSIVADALGRISYQLQQLSGQILGSVFSVLGSLVDLLLTIVLTFYLLLHGNELWEDLFRIFPEETADKIRASLKQTFNNYFGGQLTVASVMGVVITITFFIIQVPFAFLFGLAVGIMALFPFGAGLSISLVSFLMALKSIWLGLKVLAIAFVVEQIVESVIAPRLLGEFTGLNPVLVLVSLLIGAQLGGFLGLILAVPVASFIKSLWTIFKSINEHLEIPVEV
ncbi:AI-2E family transporter [Waterburya agarophytonicola K14]|uniref:AI-2E family transporter n=1 Tax=Waterburya agarophytonicola KI4 TaxID=2874699 RepID=A0A964BNN9_9CYAN|nr:AI-2E family transporter [Waterburya agarophytonicola]MCC0175366.1 AI-2E family transporter [Waterburya agarophytonicola KI4]